MSHFSVQLYCSDAAFTANQTSLATTTYNDVPNRPGHTPEAHERVQAYVLVISLTADSDTSDRIAGYAAMGQLQADRQCIAELPRESRSLNLPKRRAVFTHKSCANELQLTLACGSTGKHRPWKTPNFLASSDLLLNGIKGFKCDGQHGHHESQPFEPWPIALCRESCTSLARH